MFDLASIAEELIRAYLAETVQDMVADELMEEDPECQILSDDEWHKVAQMIADADVKISVVIH